MEGDKEQLHEKEVITRGMGDIHCPEHDPVAFNYLPNIDIYIDEMRLYIIG